MLQYLCVIPVDGMVLRPGVFSYGRLVFDTSVLLRKQHLFLHREGVLDLSEERMEGQTSTKYRAPAERANFFFGPTFDFAYVRLCGQLRSKYTTCAGRRMHYAHACVVHYFSIQG